MRQNRVKHGPESTIRKHVQFPNILERDGFAGTEPAIPPRSRLTGEEFRRRLTPPAALTTGSGCAHLLIRVAAHSFGIPRVPSQHCVTSQNDFRGTLRKQNKSTLLTGASALAQPRGIAFTPARSRAADTKRRRDVRNDRQGRCLAKMWHARHAHTQTTAAESARTLAFLNGTSG